MDILLKANFKDVEFLDGSDDINANDVLWQTIDVTTEATFIGQALWFVFQKDGLTLTGEIFAASNSDGKYSVLIPLEVVQDAGTWSFQILTRWTNAADSSKYIQIASNTYPITVSDGLPYENERPVSCDTIQGLWTSTQNVLTEVNEVKNDVWGIRGDIDTMQQNVRDNTAKAYEFRATAANSATEAEDAKIHAEEFAANAEASAEAAAMSAEQTAQTAASLQAQTAQIERNKAQIENINAVLLGNEQVAVLETEQGYTVRETANGAEIFDEQNTQVRQIQGNTVKCENLLVYPYPSKTKTENGITFTDNGDGSITVNGTSTATSYFYFSYADQTASKLPAGIYKFFSGLSGGDTTTFYIDIAVYVNGAWNTAVIHRGGPNTFTVEDNTSLALTLIIQSNQTFNNLVLRPMLTANLNAQVFQPYFTGLKSAYFNSSKSTGRNLFNPMLFDGIQLQEDGTCKTVKYYTDCTPAVFKGEPNTVYSIGQYTVDGSYVGTLGGGTISFAVNDSWVNNNYAPATFTTDENGEVSLKIGATAYANIGLNGAVFFAIYKGSYAVDTIPAYEPYTEELFAPKNATLIKKTKQINLDDILTDLTFSSSSGSTPYPNWFAVTSEFNDIKINADMFFSSNLNISKIYAGINNDSGIRNLSVQLNKECSTSDEVKTLMQGTVLLAPLETPIEKTLENTDDLGGYGDYRDTVKIPDGEDFYKVYNHGTEAIIQGETDNSEYGAMPIVKQTYFAKVGG